MPRGDQLTLMSQFELGAPERTIERRPNTLCELPACSGLWALVLGSVLGSGPPGLLSPRALSSGSYRRSFERMGRTAAGSWGEERTPPNRRSSIWPNRTDVRRTRVRPGEGRGGREEGRGIQKEPQNPGQIPGQIPGRARRASKNETETKTHTGTATTILDRELGT